MVEPAEPRTPAMRRLHGLALARLIAVASLRSFADHRGFERAATLAYYGFLALMPFLLLLIFLLGLFLRSSESLLAAMQGLLHELFPSFSESILQDLLRLARQQVWGWVSIVVLIWSLTPFTGALRSCIEQIFCAARRWPLWKTKIFDVGAAVLLLGLFLSLVVGRVVKAGLAPLAAALPGVGVWALGQMVLGLLAVAVVVAFFYVVFISVRLRPGHLLIGALTSTGLLAVIRPLFELVLRFNPNYGYVFGSLKAIFLLIIWAYYTFAVLLLGAEIMANLRRQEALLLRGLFRGPGGSPTPPAPLLERFLRVPALDTPLFREGDAGADMFYVLSGTVELTKGGHVLRVMRPGEYFGEMAMLLDAPRTATARAATEDTRLLAITRDNFDLLLRENPEIVQRLLQEMAARLKATSERLATVEAQARRPGSAV